MCKKIRIRQRSLFVFLVSLITDKTNEMITKEISVVGVSHFSAVGFHLLSLIDKGEEMEIETIIDEIESGNVLTMLHQKYGLGFDMSLFTDAQLKSLNSTFNDFTFINSRRKLGVERNGLCLLSAYCFEAIQRITSKH